MREQCKQYCQWMVDEFAAKDKQIADQEAQLAKCREALEMCRKVIPEIEENTRHGRPGFPCSVIDQIDAVLAPANPPAGEPTPDPIKEAYEEWKRLDGWLSDPKCTTKACRDFWVAIKTHVEQGGKESQA